MVWNCKSGYWDRVFLIVNDDGKFWPNQGCRPNGRKGSSSTLTDIVAFKDSFAPWKKDSNCPDFSVNNPWKKDSHCTERAKKRGFNYRSVLIATFQISTRRFASVQTTKLRYLIRYSKWSIGATDLITTNLEVRWNLWVSPYHSPWVGDLSLSMQARNVLCIPNSQTLQMMSALICHVRRSIISQFLGLCRVIRRIFPKERLNREANQKTADIT